MISYISFLHRDLCFNFARQLPNRFKVKQMQIFLKFMRQMVDQKLLFVGCMELFSLELNYIKNNINPCRSTFNEKSRWLLMVVEYYRRRFDTTINHTKTIKRNLHQIILFVVFSKRRNDLLITYTIDPTIN